MGGTGLGLRLFFFGDELEKKETTMEGKDFGIWIFAALMVLSPMAAAAFTHGYTGEATAMNNTAQPAAARANASDNTLTTGRVNPATGAVDHSATSSQPGGPNSLPRNNAPAAGTGSAQ